MHQLCLSTLYSFVHELLLIVSPCLFTMFLISGHLDLYNIFFIFFSLILLLIQFPFIILTKIWHFKQTFNNVRNTDIYSDVSRCLTYWQCIHRTRRFSPPSIQTDPRNVTERMVPRLTFTDRSCCPRNEIEPIQYTLPSKSSFTFKLYTYDLTEFITKCESYHMDYLDHMKH